MRTSRVNREEQIKVVVRLRPELVESKYSKAVYVSNQNENQLVVQTDNRKEIFMFDHIANEGCSQQDIYKMIGQQCVSHLFEGYNCCIFAYGQTGAGKTYSVLGSPNDLLSDAYCSSRGILPRLLQDIFQTVTAQQAAQNCTLTCSYIQIYNEQVFDLLSSDKRIHQVREDAKKGVFVEGLIEQKVQGYRSVISLLLEGEKTRKMASTSMNAQSSRSHTIFSILVQSELAEEDTIKSKKAKIHVVDLAGSERIKHTNVEGERLREGCNINRSLHVLCNVINSLAQAARKKKHIPYRDSKLTHYLKDSLGGNSITKLLANCHTGKHYFGDTLSTLMFAKRAKSVKTKAQLNETMGQNFDALRKEVRRLREELAQARYFRTETRYSPRSSLETELPLERTVSEPIAEPIVQQAITTQFNDEVSPKNQLLKVLQQNELHYKVLIGIYEEHMKTCLTSSNFQRKQNINIVKQWKNLQKKNISLTHLVQQTPAFTKIYKENLLLRQERKSNNSSNENKIDSTTLSIPHKDRPLNHQENDRTAINKIVQHYQRLLTQFQTTFREALQALEKSFLELQNECKLQEKKIKDLKKKRDEPQDIEELKNQNQYLHLSILELQNEIKSLQEAEHKTKLQLKEAKRSPIKSKTELVEADQNDQHSFIYDKLLEIKQEAEREAAEFNLERAQMQMMIVKLEAEINKYMAENNRLKNHHSRSKKRSQGKRPQDAQSMKHSHIMNKQAEQTPNSKAGFKSQIKYIANSAVSIASGQEDSHAHQQNLTKEILAVKMDNKRKQKQIVDLKVQLEDYVKGDLQIEEQFGKSLDLIIDQYRALSGKRLLQQSKSMKSFQKIEDQKKVIPVSKMHYKVEEGPPKKQFQNYLK